MSSRPSLAPAAATRDALLHAAGEVFAEHGFHAATVRAICQRADANIAAVNYHFGDKERLYLEVLRAAQRRSIEKYPESQGVPARATPAQRLHGFVRSFLLRLFDPEPGAWHWQLLAREMIQPTAALDTLIAERIRPLAEEVRRIVQDLLGPRADPDRIRLSGSSIVGQCLFYRHCQSVIARLFPEQGFAPADLERLAEHITEFSLAGLRGGEKTKSASQARAARRARPATEHGSSALTSSRRKK